MSGQVVCVLTVLLHLSGTFVSAPSAAVQTVIDILQIMTLEVFA